jgi:hypothetical protein
MVKTALFCFALVSTGMIGAALGLGANYASAADDCITQSNVVPPKGSRWYYHVDRATNRKCWHIVVLSTAPAAPQTQRTSARSAPGLTGRGTHQLSEAEQAALFLEFLRWKEQRSAVNSLAVEPLRPTISP